MQFIYEHEGQRYTVDLSKQPDGTLLAKIGDAVYRVHAAQLRDAGWLLRVNDRRITAHVASDGDARYVHLGGQQTTLEKADASRRKRSATGAQGDLTAEMPGQVIDVRVSEGDSVSSGDVLVVLEAMKMEIRIAAPADGVVKSVYVAVGDVVQRGQHLIDVRDDA